MEKDHRELFKEFLLFSAPDLHREIDFNQSLDFLQQELFQEIIKGKKAEYMLIKL